MHPGIHSRGLWRRTSSDGNVCDYYSMGIGLIFGPALGGLLAQPAENYPHLISEGSLFGRNRCIITKERIFQEKSLMKLQKLQFVQSLYKNWPLMSSIIVYCVFSLHKTAYSEVFSLWAVSPQKLGGLGYTTEDVGEVLSVTGFGMMIFQLFIYPYVDRPLRPVMMIRISGALTIPLLQSYAFIALLSRLSLTLVLNCATILKNVLSMCIMTSTFLLKNKAVKQEQREAANGIAMANMSLFKAIGPACGGAV